jgi:hypothetical protein
VEDFMELADKYTDLTTHSPKVQHDNSAKDAGKVRGTQLREVAAAKRGLQVALAWVDRTTELKRWRGESVFLGGSCNPTTWRKDVAIPAFHEAQIEFYNPQVDDWTPELVDIEVSVH